MLIPERERQLRQELAEKYYQYLSLARSMAVGEEADRIAQGYDKLPYWHKYSFPFGALAQAEHKVIRLRTTCESLPENELLEDDNYATLIDNAIGLANYASFFAATLMLLKEESERGGSSPSAVNYSTVVVANREVSP